MKRDYSLKNLTTMRVGGPAKYFTEIRSETRLIKTINWVKQNKIKWYVVGSGSNLVPNDRGFAGLIIRNAITCFQLDGRRITVGAGNNLFRFIRQLNRFGLAGLEKMAGIPGTVGGAIYGSAGAYGQEIKDNLVRVKIYDGNRVRWLSKKQCRFGYRESVFKQKKNWIIVAAELKLKNGNSKALAKTAGEIIKLRGQKYWPGLMCPGSFFKNIVVKDIKPASWQKKFLAKIPPDKVIHGKVPAGYILETAGAKGMRQGNIKVAKHHGNLIYNPGRARSSEITKLAKILKAKVRKKFGINLEEEIQYL